LSSLKTRSAEFENLVLSPHVTQDYEFALQKYPYEDVVPAVHLTLVIVHP